MTDMSMNRREFIGGMASAAAGAWLAPGCRTVPTGAPYSVAILGDTHYDASPNTVYHEQFIRNWQSKGQHPLRFKEFIRNARMWAGPSKKILAASGKCVTPDTAFVLQMGDLIQGDCDDEAVHRKMLKDTIAFMKGSYPQGLPFLSVCGNHDVRFGGGGKFNFAAMKPYAEFMIPYIENELKNLPHAPLTDTTYAFRQGPDLYLLIDFNRTPQNLELTKRLLDENRDVRYTFVVSHGGLFPYDEWNVRWFYLGGVKTSRADGVFDASSDAARREMRAIFAERNAIVLCGHTHRLSLKEAEFPEGMITEVTMNTVQFSSNGEEFPVVPKVLRSGVDQFGNTDWVRNTPDVRALFAEYQPYMRRYFVSQACGHARMRVSDEGVWFDYYGHDSVSPTQTIQVR